MLQDGHVLLDDTKYGNIVTKDVNRVFPLLLSEVVCCTRKLDNLLKRQEVYEFFFKTTLGLTAEFFDNTRCNDNHSITRICGLVAQRDEVRRLARLDIAHYQPANIELGAPGVPQVVHDCIRTLI